MMNNNLQTIIDFWRVFQEHEKDLSEISTADHPLYDLILKQLQQINPCLYFEFSSGSKTSELIISADGNSSLFPLVDSIVANAPNIPGWLIYPLKPKIGFPVKTTWEEITIIIADVVFDPLVNKNTQDLGLLMFVPGLSSDHVEDAHNALLRALDHALGERRFAECVKHTEVLPFPDDASKEDYIPLTELENYINWFQNKHGE